MLFVNMPCFACLRQRDQRNDLAGQSGKRQRQALNELVRAVAAYLSSVVISRKISGDALRVALKEQFRFPNF